MKLRRGHGRPFISARWRWFLYRYRRLFLTVFGALVLILWVGGAFSSDPQALSDSLVYVDREDSVVPAQRVFPDPPGPEDLERRNRTAMFNWFLENNKQKHSTRVRGEVVNCMLPTMDLSFDSNQFAFHELPPLKCAGSRAFFIRNGKFVLNRTLVPDPKQFESCSFYYVKNYDDDFYFYSQPVVKEEWPFEGVSVDHEFARVQCRLNSGLRAKEDTYTDAESARQKPHLLSRFWNIFHWRREEEEEEEELDYENILQDMDDPAIDWNLGEKKKLKTRHRRDTKPHETKDEFSDDDAMNLEDLYKWDSDDDDYYNRNYPNLESETVDYDQFTVQITPKPEVFQRISRILSASRDRRQKPDILMLGIKSMSHLSFQRMLPQTYKYLREALESVILQNYNVVGDETKDELIPMLTGSLEEDLPDVQSWKYNAQLMNAYPFIWKEFQKQGYATLFAEDEPMKSLFNTGFYGFGAAPTDHYMRPFWQAVWSSEVRKKSQRFCTGDLANHRFLLQYVEQFFEKYSNVSRFAFAFFRELTNGDDVNPAQYLDTDLVTFLDRLWRKGLLKNTLVMVFSDRGVYDYNMKDTAQAKMEERLPMMSLAFPQWFQNQHPKEYANLTQNAQRLTTPFDIHETFLDLLNPSRFSFRPWEENATAEMSLFENILRNRTCRECHIRAHWCSCVSNLVMSPNEPLVKSAAAVLMRDVISRTSSARDRCGILEFAYVYAAYLELPSWKVLKYTHSHGVWLKWPEFNSPFDIRVARLLVSVKTSPCDVIYEGVVVLDFRNHSRHSFEVVSDSVHGLGARRYHYACLEGHALFHDGRRFCCCRNFKKPGLT